MKFGFVLIIILFLLANFYVFQRLWVLMPTSNVGRILLISFAVLVIASFFIFFAFSEVMPIWVSSVFYVIGTSWFFIFIYFFLITLFKDFIRLLHITPPGTFTHYSRDNWAGFILAVGFVSMLMICGYLKYRWKVKEEISVSVEKNIEGRDSLRIVAVSDLHLGYSIGKKELQGWVSLINREKPDVVLIAGDIIDNSIRPLRVKKLAQYFKDIEAPLGVYTCLGNHEYISGLDESMAFIQEAGITLLKDAHVLVDSCFYIVGRDDRSNLKRKPLSGLVSGLDKTKPVILLDHQPYHLEEAEENGIDLQFSGHTHRGQVWPISLITDKIYEKSHGYLKKGNTHVYVSSGIGIWGGKFRIGTQSEYVVINLKKNEGIY